MNVRKSAEKRKTERMSDTSFRMMSFFFKIMDFLFPHIDKRVKKFGITKGMTVVDYGCGPGRYSTRFSELAGETGKVYALDIHDLAIDTVQQKVKKNGITNIEAILAKGYDSTLPDNTADAVCAIDMFFPIKKPSEFLAEIKRIIKKDGILIIDDGHQPRRVTKDKLADSELWEIIEETKDHLKCKVK